MPNGVGTSMFYKDLTLHIEQNKCVCACTLQVKFISSCLKIFKLVLILNLLCLLALEDKGLRINLLWVKLKLT